MKKIGRLKRRGEHLGRGYAEERPLSTPRPAERPKTVPKSVPSAVSRNKLEMVRWVGGFGEGFDTCCFCPSSFSFVFFRGEGVFVRVIYGCVLLVNRLCVRVLGEFAKKNKVLRLGWV